MNLYYWNKTTLEFNKVSWIKILIILCIISGLLYIGLSTIYKKGFDKGKVSEIMEKDVVLLYHDVDNSSFNRKNFYEYLKRVNIKFPNIVFAQAIKESGLKSSLFKDNNNPFGMKQATKRPNMQSGAQDGYAYYDTWKEAIIDYSLYQSYVGLSKIKTENEYLNYLKQMKYYDVDHPGNVNYLSDLKNISDNIEDYLK